MALDSGRISDPDPASGGFVDRKSFKTLIGVSIALGLAACGASPHGEVSIEPSNGRQFVAGKINPDQALADKVRKALEIEVRVGAQDVEVTATNGTVQHWGLVDSTKARKHIEQTAAGVVGVRAVDSRLVTDPGA